MLKKLHLKKRTASVSLEKSRYDASYSRRSTAYIPVAGLGLGIHPLLQALTWTS